jgi:hypothetical protein
MQLRNSSLKQKSLKRSRRLPARWSNDQVLRSKKVDVTVERPIDSEGGRANIVIRMDRQCIEFKHQLIHRVYFSEEDTYELRKIFTVVVPVRRMALRMPTENDRASLLEPQPSTSTGVRASFLPTLQLDSDDDEYASSDNESSDAVANATDRTLRNKHNLIAMENLYLPLEIDLTEDDVEENLFNFESEGEEEADKSIEEEEEDDYDEEENDNDEIENQASPVVIDLTVDDDGEGNDGSNEETEDFFRSSYIEELAMEQEEYEDQENNGFAEETENFSSSSYIEELAREQEEYEDNDTYRINEELSLDLTVEPEELPLNLSVKTEELPLNLSVKTEELPLNLSVRANEELPLDLSVETRENEGIHILQVWSQNRPDSEELD